MQDIADQLHRAFEGEPWHGPSLAQVLTGVGLHDAAAHPIAGAHSIWELVLHVTAWTRVVACRLAGENADQPEEGDFPEVLEATAEAWDAAKAGLAGAEQELLARVNAFSKKRLMEPFRDSNYYVLLHGQAQHLAYHGGQIALLKRALQR